jgi:hypothetical protein
MMLRPAAGWKKATAALMAALILSAQSSRAADGDLDPQNPTCPRSPNWSEFREMQLTPITRNGVHILMAEGAIDAQLPTRLQAVLEANPLIDEIWMRSPGGNARAGTQAGRIIRARFNDTGIPIVTRIPNGWTCFSACNFMFLGGSARVVEPRAYFMMHMFTFTNDRGAIRYATEQGADTTAELIGDVEQESALLASEDNDFLIRMGIPRTLLTEIMYQQRAVGSGERPAQRHCLSSSELSRYRVHRPPNNDN